MRLIVLLFLTLFSLLVFSQGPIKRPSVVINATDTTTWNNPEIGDVSGLQDSLDRITMTANLQLKNYWINNDGDNNEGLIFATNGDITTGGNLNVDGDLVVTGSVAGLVVTGSVDLDNITEDVTPDRSLVQNSDGQVKYKEVIYGYFQDKYSGESNVLVEPAAAFDWVSSWDIEESQNITSTNDSTFAFGADGRVSFIISITFTITANYSTNTNYRWFVDLNDTGIEYGRVTTSHDPAARAMTTITGQMDVESGDYFEIKVDDLGTGSTIAVQSININIWGI